MSLPIDEVTALLIEAARSEVLPLFQRLKAHEIEEKSGPGDLVTAADLACERFLEERLGTLLPGARVVGEEAVAEEPALMDALHAPGMVWIIDPVDGTYNFAHGDERFAIIVALVHDGEAVAGWIHDPVGQRTLVAERGAGAYFSSGGEREPARVSAPAPLAEMGAVLYVGKKREPALYQRVRDLRPRLGARSYSRSAAMEYLAMAEGSIHYAIFTRQLPWDHAAGCLIHAEAGGHQAYLDGAPYRPVPESKPLLLAPDEPTWTQLRDLFTGAG